MYKDKQERIKQIQFTAYSLYQEKVYYEYLNQVIYLSTLLISSLARYLFYQVADAN